MKFKFLVERSCLHPVLDGSKFAIRSIIKNVNESSAAQLRTAQREATQHSGAGLCDRNRLFGLPIANVANSDVVLVSGVDAQRNVLNRLKVFGISIIHKRRDDLERDIRRAVNAKHRNAAAPQEPIVAAEEDAVVTIVAGV